MIATNLTELIRSKDLDMLLKLCGESIKTDRNCSDYSYFCAICRAFPLLRGHDFSLFLQKILCNELSVQLVPSVETAAEIWHAVAERLLQKPCAVSCYAYRQEPNDAGIDFRLLSAHQTTYFDVSTLLETNACTWKAWEAELDTRISAIDSKKLFFGNFQT